MEWLRAEIKDIGMNIIRVFLKIFYIFPIKKNRVIFESYSGKQYSCNPKYISEELVKSSEDYEIIWAFNEPKKYEELQKQGIKVIHSTGLKFWIYRLTARVTISNVPWKNYTPIRPGQYEIQTWHGGGGGYKKTLADDKGEQKNKLAMKRHMKNFERYSLVLTSSATSLKTNARRAMHYKGVVLGGTARNDILLNQNRPDLDQKVRNYFGIDTETKIVLYAPTWRRGATKDDFDVDYEALKNALSIRFGGKWVILRRMHWEAAKFFSDSSDKYINAEAYPDMQELLYVVDVLVSDYSSSIWDFSFTGRPCFLFCKDLKKYKEERDFYNPITSWGFPLAQSNQELVEKIKTFDKDEYAAAMVHQHKKNNAFENGHTSENVCKIIYAMCYGDGTLPDGLPYKFYKAEEKSI